MAITVGVIHFWKSATATIRVCYLLFVVRYSLFVVRCSLFVIRCSSFVIHFGNRLYNSSVLLLSYSLTLLP